MQAATGSEPITDALEDLTVAATDSDMAGLRSTLTPTAARSRSEGLRDLSQPGPEDTPIFSSNVQTPPLIQPDLQPTSNRQTSHTIAPHSEGLLTRGGPHTGKPYTNRELMRFKATS